MVIIELHQQSWITATETMWPTKPKIVASNPLQKSLAKFRGSPTETQKSEMNHPTVHSW